MNLPKEEPQWLIWSLKHHAWWGPSQSGYFRLLHLAGRYTLAEAREIVANSNRYTLDVPNSAIVEDLGEVRGG